MFGEQRWCWLQGLACKKMSSLRHSMVTSVGPKGFHNTPLVHTHTWTTKWKLFIWIHITQSPRTHNRKWLHLPWHYRTFFFFFFFFFLQYNNMIISYERFHSSVSTMCSTSAVISRPLFHSLPVSVSPCVLFSFPALSKWEPWLQKSMFMFTRSSFDTPKSNKVGEVVSKQCDVPHNAFDAC